MSVLSPQDSEALEIVPAACESYSRDPSQFHLRRAIDRLQMTSLIAL